MTFYILYTFFYLKVFVHKLFSFFGSLYFCEFIYYDEVIKSKCLHKGEEREIVQHQRICKICNKKQFLDKNNVDPEINHHMIYKDLE